MSGTISVDLTQDDVDEATQQNSNPVPEGEYDAVIFDAEISETNNTYKFGDEERTSEYLDTEFRIINGEYEDRRVFDIFMTETPDQKKDDEEWIDVPSDQLWHEGFIELFEAIGRTEELLGDDPIELESLYGEELRINTYIQEDEEYGDSASISYVRPPAGSSDDENSFIPPE